MEPGVYDISNEQYHSSVGVSRSSLELLRRSPAAYIDRIRRNIKRPPSKALTDGTAVHTAVLEPERFEQEYRLVPDGIELTPTGKIGVRGRAQLEQQWGTSLANITVLDRPTYEMCVGIREAVSKHELSRDLLTQGAAEKSAYWKDPSTDILCKIRPDYWRPGIVIDLKTTESAHPREFISSVIKFNYTLQAAFYMDGAQADEFYFIAVEKTSPYQLAVYRVTPKMRQIGQIMYREALYTLKQCLETDTWPGYAPIIYDLELPHWYQGASTTAELQSA